MNPIDRIICVGGGPGGLYFALLMKLAFPNSDIRVIERNGRDEMDGWGIFLHADTLQNLESADWTSARQIRSLTTSWDTWFTYLRGSTVNVRAPGSAIHRKSLVNVLRTRCEQLGVKLQFERGIDDMEMIDDADLIVGSDGLRSFVRNCFQDDFRARLRLHACRYCWLATERRFEGFGYIFKESPFGMFRVCAYPFDSTRSGWVVECADDVWRAAGLDRATKQDTAKFCSAFFPEFLGNSRVLSNQASWNQFGTVTCERWSRENVVLIGDAAHTVHFSTGSGLKLAIEDAIHLAATFQSLPDADVTAVLQAYEQRRRPEIEDYQRFSLRSLDWLQNCARYIDQHPFQFAQQMMTAITRHADDSAAPQTSRHAR